MAHRIAVVEDDEAVRSMLVEALEEHGHDVVCYPDGVTGLKGLKASPPTLVLLDLRLPGLSGIEVCRALRADPTTARIFVVMLTGLSAEADEILGFEVGADDYVTKPFTIAALTARLSGVMRRVSPSPGDAPLSAGPLTLHPGRHEVTLAGKKLALTPTEYRMLHLLLANPDRILTRQELVEGDPASKEGRDRKADVHVTALRGKLGAHARLIDTVYGKGYRLALREDRDFSP